MESGGRRPDGARWRESLAALKPELDRLPADMEWTLSGGSALSLQLHHREGRDLDLAFRSVMALERLSPATNPAIRAFATTWREHGHFTRLWSAAGEVDLVVARNITGLSPIHGEVEGMWVKLDRPEEIIARKIAHRGRHLRPIDVFDIARAGEEAPLLFLQLQNVAPDRLEAAIERTAELGASWGSGEEFRLPGTSGMLPNCSSTASKWMERALQGIEKRQPAARSSQEEIGGR